MAENFPYNTLYVIQTDQYTLMEQSLYETLISNKIGIGSANQL